MSTTSVNSSVEGFTDGARICVQVVVVTFIDPADQAEELFVFIRPRSGSVLLRRQVSWSGGQGLLGTMEGTSWRSSAGARAADFRVPPEVGRGCNRGPHNINW